MRRVVPVAMVFLLLLAVVCPAFCVTQTAPAADPHSCCHHSGDGSKPCGQQAHSGSFAPAAAVRADIPLALFARTIPVAVDTVPVNPRPESRFLVPTPLRIPLILRI